MKFRKSINGKPDKKGNTIREQKEESGSERVEKPIAKNEFFEIFLKET